MPRYLCIQRSAPSSAKREPPSPAQMQDMFAAFNAWKAKFADQLVDLGGKLMPTGKLVSAAATQDGPFIEAKELVGGYMIVAADSYEAALEVVRESPGVMMPGSSVEVREIHGS